MSNKIHNILLAGVGGQGILLASEIMSEVLMLAGYDVKKSEVHGMAQRGGSVTSHVRFGTKVFSSIIPEGEADILFGFEQLETFRYLPMVRQEGQVLVNDLKILPPSVALGQEKYPTDIPGKISARFPKTKVVNGMELALAAGNARTVNTVLLGALSTLMEIEQSLWQKALENMVPDRFIEENRRAFELGRNS